MMFKQGFSGNPHGNRNHSRHLLNQEFLQALLLHFRKDGKKVIERVARNQPAVYMKICALLVPREMKLEHTNAIKDMTDEELESAIATLKAIMAAQAGESAKIIETTAEPVALLAPEARSPIDTAPEPKPQRKPNRLMMEADTAFGPRERKPRKRTVPSPPGA